MWLVAREGGAVNGHDGRVVAFAERVKEEVVMVELAMEERDGERGNDTLQARERKRRVAGRMNI